MLYPLLLTALGLLLLALAGLPLLLRQLPLSVPIVLVLLGAGLALLPSAGTPPDPREHAEFVERLTEFVVIVSLMGAGLKLDTALGWRSWRRAPHDVGIDAVESYLPKKLVAAAGIFSGLLFAAVILLQGSATLFLAGCAR